MAGAWGAGFARPTAVDGGVAAAAPLRSRRALALPLGWLEIGFGAGEHIAWQAAQNPTRS